jgi:hypothetical protein
MDDYAFDCTVLALALVCLCTFVSICHGLRQTNQVLRDDDECSDGEIDVLRDDDEIDVALVPAPPCTLRRITRRHSW